MKLSDEIEIAELQISQIDALEKERALTFIEASQRLGLAWRILWMRLALLVRIDRVVFILDHALRKLVNK